MSKKPAKTNDAFSASQVGVLVEDLRNEIRAVAESQTSLVKKVDMMYEEMGRQREDIWTLKTDVRIIKEDIKVLKEDVKVLKEDVSMLKEDMKIVKADVAEIKNIISDHGERISKVEEIVVK